MSIIAFSILKINPLINTGKEKNSTKNILFYLMNKKMITYYLAKNKTLFIRVLLI